MNMNTYIGNEKQRYILANCTNSEIGNKTLFCIGVNPSIASDMVSDPTWTRVKETARKNTYNNAVMLNLYPERATNFNDLSQHVNDVYHKNNINHIKDILTSIEEINIWCAWGNLIEQRSFLIKCLSDIYRQIKHLNINWLNFGSLTKSGNPMHPLARGKYGFSYKLSFSKFNLENYLRIKNEH